jgi:formiminoglutamase
MQHEAENTPEMSENKAWRSVHGLLGADADAPVALIGLPLVRESISRGRYDLGAATLRAALKRMSVYDLETGCDLSGMAVFDAGEIPVAAMTPAEAFEPICEAVRSETRMRALTILVGGHNAITRPGMHGLGLKNVGLITLDAHFDLRDTDGGLNNGNPVQALLDDGLPGRNISQIGLAPFANTKKAHRKAMDAGISVYTMRDCTERGLVRLVEAELDRLSATCEAVYVDFDIDVIDRAQMPAAPGARPGGIAVRDFFAAARVAGAHRAVKCVDLAEFDPSRDVGEVGALTAARWFTEILAGYQSRSCR